MGVFSKILKGALKAVVNQSDNAAKPAIKAGAKNAIKFFKKPISASAAVLGPDDLARIQRPIMPAKFKKGINLAMLPGEDEAPMLFQNMIERTDDSWQKSPWKDAYLKDLGKNKYLSGQNTISLSGVLDDDLKSSFGHEARHGMDKFYNRPGGTDLDLSRQSLTPDDFMQLLKVRKRNPNLGMDALVDLKYRKNSGERLAREYERMFMNEKLLPFQAGYMDDAKFKKLLSPEAYELFKSIKPWESPARAGRRPGIKSFGDTARSMSKYKDLFANLDSY